MVTHPSSISSRDVVLIDDPFHDLDDAALLGPNFVIIHNLQTRRQRFPYGLRLTDFPQWFEAKRMLIPYETRVSHLGTASGPASECEFTPIYMAPEKALFDARRILVSAASIAELEDRRGVIGGSAIPSDKGEAFKVGQSSLHVLHDFYIACAETSSDPVAMLRSLVAKTEAYRIRRVWGREGPRKRRA